MKKCSFFIVSFVLMTLLFACSKKPDQPLPQDKPVPTDPDLQRSFRLTFANIPTQPGILNLKAIVTIRNSQNQVVAANKVIPVGYMQQYLTDTVILAKGSYYISGVLLKEGDANVRFASPVEGSEKASLVNHPLSVTIVLDEKTEKSFPIDVLPVGDNDKPQQFGYPEGSFGNRPGDPVVTDKQIFIRPLFKIGEIVYDSVPCQLVLRSWDPQGNMDYKALYLPAGLQAILLPANAVKHQLSISKWGTYDEMTLMKADVQENSIYVIGGNAPALKLKTVFTYKITNGVSKPETKTEFAYESNGKVRERVLWVKNADGSTHRLRKEFFEYQFGKITKTRAFDASDVLQATSSFSYNAEGRVATMEEVTDGQTTTASAHYTPLPTSSGITQDYRLDIRSTSTRNNLVEHYSRTMRGGSMLTDIFVTSNGNREEGLYGSDFGINPYSHLAIPDPFLTQYMKHNVKEQWKTWYGGYPTVEIYDFKYTYNAQGYPTELMVKYRSYRNRTDAFTIRTVFQYE